MIKDEVKVRLADPSYFAMHLQAAAAIRTIGQINWYDSHFLRRYEVARHFLSQVRPDVLGSFVEGFAPLRPCRTFSPELLDDVFDESTRRRITEISRDLVPEADEFQIREGIQFGRNVIWDNPFFLELQEQMRGQVSKLVGLPLRSSYNFLSLYGGKGKCEIHIDHPNSMYTFDYCIEQSEEWPIYFSRVVDWPTADEARQFAPANLKNRDDLAFTSYLLRPNQAVIFNGSSQWHYRDPIRPGGFCHLLFFHYYPDGCEDLVVPAQWARHFGIPELEPLCDLFHHDCIDAIP